MLNWTDFTLFLLITMRMAGFVLTNPIFGRSGLPGLFRGGVVLALSVSCYYNYDSGVALPGTSLELALKLLLEFGLGAVLSLIIRFFFYIVEQAGEVVDTQMGMSMAKTYDAGAHSSLTTTASLLNILMVLLFFAAGGHITLLRIILTSGEVVPFGAARFGEELASRGVELFAECALLAVKLSMPILAAELMGQVGMGVLMKVIPQINVFAINIELKVLVGLVMLYLLISPISDFLLEAEGEMLAQLRQILTFMGG